MPDPQPIITANVTAPTLRKARKAAFDAGKSLRALAGEILTAAFTRKKP